MALLRGADAELGAQVSFWAQQVGVEVRAAPALTGQAGPVLEYAGRELELGGAEVCAVEAGPPGDGGTQPPAWNWGEAVARFLAQATHPVVVLYSLGGLGEGELFVLAARLAGQLGGCVVDARPFSFQASHEGFGWAQIDPGARWLQGPALYQALPTLAGVRVLSGTVAGSAARALAAHGETAVRAAIVALAGQVPVVALETPPSSVPAAAAWVGVTGPGTHRDPALPARALALARQEGPAALFLLGRGPSAWDAELAAICAQVGLLHVQRVRSAGRRARAGGALASQVAAWVRASSAANPHRTLPATAQALAFSTAQRSTSALSSQENVQAGRPGNVPPTPLENEVVAPPATTPGAASRSVWDGDDPAAPALAPAPTPARARAGSFLPNWAPIYAQPGRVAGPAATQLASHSASQPVSYPGGQLGWVLPERRARAETRRRA